MSTHPKAAARRAAYLAIAKRRLRPGRGSTLAFLQTQESYPMPDLNKILSEVRYVVIGGTATSLYMPLRTTKDVSVGRLTPVQSPRELI